MQTFIYTFFILLIMGMIIVIGATIFFFIYETRHDEIEDSDDFVTPEKKYVLIGKVRGVNGVSDGIIISLNVGQICTLGKASNCDFQIMNNVVSRMHCSIKLLENGAFEIMDFSTNGTYYNNYRLEKNTPFQVPSDSLLAIGDANNVI